MDNRDSGADGLILLDANGRIQAAVGAGADKRISALAQDKKWIAEARQRKLQPLTLDSVCYIFVVVTLTSGDLILIHKSPGNPVVEFIGSVDFAYDVIEHLLSDPFEAMTIIDKNKRVAYLSPIREKHLGLSRGEANGRLIREVIENSKLDRVLATGHAEIGELHRMRDEERVVSRIPIKRAGAVVGAVGRIMFKDVNQLKELAQKLKTLEGQVEFFQREAAMLRNKTYGTENMIGDSAAMQKLRNDIVKVAGLEIPVLITGENGTGKELVAHCLHRLSPRRDGPLIMLNAAALPATLVESELFGHDPGAFTGAHKNGRKGKFEQADGGTLFLDEIGDMPMDIQVKMLRVLQDRNVTRLGGDQAREIDFRLVTATNCDLPRAMTENRFRVDLFYRISAITLEVPPLRKRVEDIPQLAQYFLDEVAARYKRAPPELTDSAISYLCEQLWPGNVRQLRHELERGFVFDEDGKITPDDLRQFAGQPALIPDVKAAPEMSPPSIGGAGKTIRDGVAELERELIRAALSRHRGNKKRTADELGISRSYLYKVLEKFPELDA